MTRSRKAENRVDGAALGGLLAAYAVVFGLFAVWFYPLLHARQNSNPGLAAYQPPPATVVDERTVARLPVQPAPPLAEIETRPVEPKTNASPAPEQPATVVDHQPERIIDVKKPRRAKPPTHPSERHDPLRGYAAAYSGYGRGSAAYPGYSGGRPF